MRTFGRFLRFLLAVTLTLVVLDVFIQVAGIESPLESRFDPEIGTIFIADRPFVRYHEGFFVGSANAWGGLGEGRPPERTDDEIRIVLMGDSSALGHTVLERHHFGRTIERTLTAALDRPAIVLNFGRADYNLRNTHHLWRSYVSRWDCDVVLFVVDGDDLAPARSMQDDPYPFSEARGDSLVANLAFRTKPRYRLTKGLEPIISRSALLRLLHGTRSWIQRGDHRRALAGKLAPHVDDEAPACDFPPAALSPTSRAILADLARDPRAVLVFKSGAPGAYRAAADSVGLPVIDLAEDLVAMESAGDDPNWWSVTGKRGHWNHQAHRVIGAGLGCRLAESPLMKRTRR